MILSGHFHILIWFILLISQLLPGMQMPEFYRLAGSPAYVNYILTPEYISGTRSTEYNSLPIALIITDQICRAGISQPVWGIITRHLGLQALVSQHILIQHIYI